MIYCEFTRLGQQHPKNNNKELSQLWVDAVHLRETEKREREREREREGERERQRERQTDRKASMSVTMIYM